MGVQTTRGRRQPARDERHLSRFNIAHRDVRLAAKQVVQGIGQRQFDDQFGMALPEHRKYRGQMFDAEHFAGSQSYRATHGARGAGRRAHQRARRRGE